MTGLPNPSEPVVVAVSGGLDSVVLLHMLHSAGIRGVVAHVNYGFRGEESDADEALVRRLAQDLGWPVRVSHPNIESGNRQDESRKHRYDFFEEVRIEIGASCIVLAHHQDDQVETIVLKLLRGARLDACHGMLPQRGRIVRPLLSTPQSELIEYARIHELEWREDASNADRKYLRNHVRHDILPHLDKSKLLALGEASLAYARDLDRLLSRHTEGVMVKDSLFLCGDSEVAKAAVCRFARGRGVNVSDEEATALTGSRRWQTGKKIGPFIREREGWSLPSVGKAPELTRHAASGGVALDADRLGIHPLIRTWQAGDRLDGKKISDLMTNAKWPAHLRLAAFVILSHDGNIAAVKSDSQILVSKSFCAIPSTKNKVFLI